MADFRVNVTAETSAAERKLREVDKVADKATKARAIKVDASFIGNATQGFKDLQNNLKEAANNVQTFYRISRTIPGVGDKVREFEDLAKNTASVSKEQFLLGTALKENAKAGSILANTLELAGSASGRLISNLAKVGFATFALKEAVGVLQAAWTGFFNNTIGREIQLRETILKTQTTLASTNKVFKNGAEITDPYQKIVSLTSAVGKNIDSIRERSIALAGVTSNEVIEVFGIVAGQIGQIGGGLKEAEDLAINFAAALGTFGIPLYQARQEIGSILRGDITMDSYLAKSLGITNEDIAKAKSQAGGVVKFLEDRLAAAVAGQKIAAQGFAGVVSNIRDLGELVGQNFGRGLLNPLLAGLTNVFETLFRIRQQVFDIASAAGEAIGRSGQLILGLTAGRTGIGAGDPSKAAAAASAIAKRAFTELEALSQRTVGAIVRTIEALRPTALILADAFRNIAEAFVKVKVGTFEALASAISNIATVASGLSSTLASLFNLYARFLNTDAVRYVSEIASVLSILKRVGLDTATQFVLFGRFIVSTVVPSIGALGTALAGLIAAIAAVAAAVGKIILVFAGLATALVGPAAAIPALAAGLKALATELVVVGRQATGAGTQLQVLSASFRGAGAAAKVAGASILASLGWIAAIQIGLAVVVDSIGKWQRAQEDARAEARAAEALRRLSTTYKGVGESADSATKSARDFEQSIVDANYNKGVQELEKVREKLAEIKDLTSNYEQDFGDVIRSLAQILNPENFAVQQRPGDKSFADSVFRTRQEEAQKLIDKLKEIDKTRDKGRAEENLRLEAQNRVNLEKEIGEIRRQQQDQLFQLRQQQAQKEVEIFRLAGELRIFQMEQANKKLIEGEEGASAAALESLNNYLSIRERGELDIESAKKEIVIEATNLEKQISDYRLENERKIAEIRKRAGDYEQKVANYRRQVAGQPAIGAAGPLSQLIGGVESYGGNYGAFNRGGSNNGHTAHGSGIDPNLVNMTIAEIQRRQLAPGVPRNQQLHAVGKYQIIGSTLKSLMNGGYGETGVKPTDKFSPENQEKLFAALARNRVVAGDVNATMRGLRQEWIGLQNVPDAKLKPAALALMNGGGAGTASAPPTAPTFDDIGAPAVEKYAEAVRGLSGALERARALQEALTNAKTAAAFEEIAKAAFPRTNVEQYEDQLVEARTTLDALAKSAGEAYDPERLRIAVETQSRLTIQERELEQIRAKARQTLKPEELKKLEEDLTKRKAEFVAQLQKEKQLREQLLPLIRAQAAIEDLRRDTVAVPFDIQRAGVQALGTMASVYGNQEDPIRRRMIEAETRIAERRIQLEQDLGKTTEQVRRELAEYAVAQRAAAQTLGELDQSVEDFVAVLGTIREVSRTITEGYKGFFKEVLSGGDIGDALSSMLESVTDRFLSLALDAAFKPMEQMFTEQLKSLFGIEDPMQRFQEENTAALGAITTAQEAAAAAQERAADTQVRAAEMQLQAATAATTPSLPGTPQPPQAGAGALPLTVLPYSGDTLNPFVDATENVTSILDDLSAQVAEGVSTLPTFNQSINSLATTVTTADQGLQTVGSQASQLVERFNGLMKAAGTAMSVLGGIAMAYASVQQIGKGGTYNTLMGIAGIFGAISSVAGGLSSIGGLFGGGGGGGGGAFNFTPVDSLPSVGSFNPLPSNFSVPSFAGGGYTGPGAMAGGLDGRGGFMAMLHPNETVVPGDPYAATAAALAGGVMGTPRPVNDNSPIRLETRVINGVEYATVDQLEQATRQAEMRGAQRGQAMAFGAMRNSVKTRKKLGM